MRIAYVCADAGIPIFGRKGGSVHVQEIVRAFRNRGADVDVFAARLGGNPPPDLEDLAIHDLPVAPGEDLQQRERSAIRVNHDLRATLAGAGRFDFVYERYSLWSFAG